MKEIKIDFFKPVVEGKSKKIYKIDEKTAFMIFKPHLRSITYNREGNIIGTEIERLKATEFIFNLLSKNGIKTQLLHDKIVKINGIEGLLVKHITPIPIEFICRFYAYGSIVRLYPSLVKEGQKLEKMLMKFDLKQDISISGVDDPTLNESYIVGLNLLTKEQLEKSKNMLEKIGYILNKHFKERNVKFIDVKMEFGFDENNEIVLIDEISQDCMRANYISTDETITKDAYRQAKSDEEVLNIYKKFNDIIMS